MLTSPPQIGNRFALTAAHCLYDDDNEEVLPATTFSIMLGLHDRRKTKEANRWLFHQRVRLCIGVYFRRQIRVSKVIIHENFTESSNDIALLRLGKTYLYDDPLDVSFLITTNSQKTEWISPSSALSVFLMLVKGSLTRMGMSMVSSSLIWQCYPVPGWGDTGVQDTSTDKLQETVVPIVDPSSCGEDVDEDLIVCAGGLGVGKGPCKVSLQIILISHDNPG